MSRFRISQLTSRIALVALVLALLIPFGTPTVEATNDGSIEGTVTDNQTGLPVSGALVQVADLGLEATSNTAGQFSWQGVSLAQDVIATTVTVNASGYGEWRIEDVRVVAGDTLELDVSLGTEPTLIKVPPPGFVRPTSDQAMQPEAAVDLTATDQTDAPLPATIDVRVTGYAYCDTSRPYTVETVDFKEYVKHVLPNEWIPGEIEGYGMPRESLRAGAMAVKMYAWSYIAAGGKWNDADVYDSTCDQVYIPSVSYTSTNNAVDFTWNWRLTWQSDGSLVRAFYRAHYSQCEDANLADRCMGQYDSAALAYNRLTWDEILASFYVGSQINDIWSPPGGYSLRFEGNGYGDLDRVKIMLDGPARPVDIGATDFTLEFWLKARPGENGTASCSSADGAWHNGNAVFDRDVYGVGDYGDYGVSLMSGQIAFGVNNGTSGITLCGTASVTDERWHHIAVQRAINTGLLQVWVDGVLDSEASGPTGNISYRDGRSVNISYPNEPFLVIGAEKHDLDNNLYPSFLGWLDEIRLSTNLRYDSAFPLPRSPFSPDSQTAALYHFDEGYGNSVKDSSNAAGGPSDGDRKYGGVVNGPEWTVDTPWSAPPPSAAPPKHPPITSIRIARTTYDPSTRQARWFLQIGTIPDQVPADAFVYIVWLRLPQEWQVPWVSQQAAGENGPARQDAQLKAWITDPGNCELGGLEPTGYKWRAFVGSAVDQEWTSDIAMLRGGISIPDGSVSPAEGTIRIVIGSGADRDGDGQADIVRCASAVETILQ